MRRKLIGGNWKMYGSQSEVMGLVNGVLAGLGDHTASDVVVFPSFVYLPLVQTMLDGESIGLGAQNFNEHEEGAYTGEVSGKMLYDIGCSYVLVGHSERRQYYQESNELVALKCEAALTNNLTPVLCVGETQEQRELHQTEEVVLAQIDAVVERLGIEAFEKIEVAYEPVWAIGTGLTATPEQAQEVHYFIRKQIAVRNQAIADNLRIIYGGSVKGNNAESLFAMPDIDGGLVGGASLKADEFVTICKAV